MVSVKKVISQIIMKRLTIEEYGCLLALVGKSRSEDHFTHCAAVAISKDKRILGISYNGLKSGKIVPNWMKEEENRVKKSSFYIHAESNLFALLKKGDCDLLICNISPCISCCNTIVSHGVRKVVYIKEYEKCNKFKEFFDFHKIEYKELNKKSKERILEYLKDLNNFKELF